MEDENSSGNAGNYGWIIDNIQVISTPQWDGSIIAIPKPTTSVIGSTVIVKGTVKNLGYDTLKSIPISYTLNGASPVSETWVVPNPYLLPGDTGTYTFNTTFVSPATDYQLCVYTQIAGDSFTSNDQLCKSVPITLPPLDAGVIVIISPVYSNPLWTPKTIVVSFKNFGTGSLSTMDIQYQINSQNPVIDTWSGTALAQGDSLDYTFQTTYYSPIGSIYQFCAKTMLTGDINASNDESCRLIMPVINPNVQELANGMKLWQNMPNPASDITNIRYEIPNGGNVSFDLVDVLGNVLMSISKKEISGIHNIEIDVNKLAKGIYYYSIEFGGYRITKQMVVT